MSEVVTTQKAKEEELYQERLAFVTKLNKEADEKKGDDSFFDKYKEFMTKYFQFTEPGVVHWGHHGQSFHIVKTLE